MGLSKKKLKKQIKVTSEEIATSFEILHKKKKAEQDKKSKTKLTDDQLFSTNVTKDFKEKREKLKKDRFKEI
jgi:hypothetical protein